MAVEAGAPGPTNCNRLPFGAAGWLTCPGSVPAKGPVKHAVLVPVGGQAVTAPVTTPKALVPNRIISPPCKPTTAAFRGCGAATPVGRTQVPGKGPGNWKVTTVAAALIAA